MEFGRLDVKHRVGKTYTGVPFDIAKSAVQKYIRRGNWRLAARIIVDINQVRLAMNSPEDYAEFMNSKKTQGSDYVPKNIKSTSKAILTNIKNRLLVIASEDISVANHDAARVVSNMSSDMKTMVRTAIYLARSPKLRLLSDYKTLFLLPPYYWKGTGTEQQRYLTIHRDLQEIFPFMKHDSENWREDLGKNNIHRFFYGLGRDMLERGVDIVLNELRTLLSKSSNIIVKSLINTYHKMKHAEKPIYLYQACLVYMNYGDMTVDIDISDITDEWIDNIEREILAGKTYEIDTFCIDRHTRTGVSCSKLQFAIEGARVENQQMSYYEWNARLIYILYKKLQEQSGKSISEHLVELKPYLEDIFPQKGETDDDGDVYQFLGKYLNTSAQEAFLIVNQDMTQRRPVPAPRSAISLAKPNPIQKPKRIQKPKIQRPIPKPRPILMESEYFKLIARAQIGTSHSKTDVYFAEMKKRYGKWNIGDRVVVKGPYLEVYGCRCAQAMAKWKRSLGLPAIDNIECMYLVPDLWNDVKGLGIRYGNKINLHNKYPFMISDDLLKYQELPLKQKEATKTWEPTITVDWNHRVLKEYYWKMTDHWALLSNLEKSRLICYHIIRYMVNIGDLADRNFMLIDHTVYALDEDAPSKTRLNKPGSLLRKKRSQLIVTWLQNNENWQLISNFLQLLPSFPPPSPLRATNVVQNNQDWIIDLFSDITVSF